MRLKPKEKYALRLYYEGSHSREECMLECNLSRYKFDKILNSEEGKKYCDKISEELEHDLKSLHGAYIRILRDGMTSRDSRERIATASLYQRSPMFVSAENNSGLNSAEDVVKKMIETPAAHIENKGTKLLHFDPKKTGTDDKLI